MRLPFNILTKTYVKPDIYLCETDKTKICKLETSNTNAILKFNSYSELTFEVGRFYSDLISGETLVFPYYEKIEAPRLVYVEGIAYFEIQTPELSADGIKESKDITAYSLEYTLAQKYLENFYINTGEIGSVEVTYADEKYNSINPDLIKPVVLYDPSNKELSLLHLVLEKIYGWEIGYVDLSLQKLSRTFEIDRLSVYDFLMNEVCAQFNCYIVFDTINNKINVYAESLSETLPGDGVTTEFVLTTPFSELGTVSIDGYKTTRYTYNPITGKLIFDEAPKDGVSIKVTDGALAEWETDVFIGFDNLSQEINISYDADEIKTVLTVKGAEDLDIREVNMGLPYLVDLSYFHHPDWLGQDLFDAYNQYLKDYNALQNTYEDNAKEINAIYDEISYEQNRMSSDDVGIVVLQQNITPTTVGQYFVRGGTAPNYYYEEKKLPDDYNANESYYLFEGKGLNLTESDVSYLYAALQEYFRTYFNERSIDMEKLNECNTYFSFAQNDFDNMCDALKNIDTFMTPASIVKKNIESTLDSEFIFACVNRFLDIVWNQLGSCPLEYCYKKAYTKLQTTAMEAGWGNVDSAEYGNYFAVYLLVKSIERALINRNNKINNLYKQMQLLQDANGNIGSGLDLDAYFKQRYPDKHKQFMTRLSAFLREDEYTDDNFVETGLETLEELYQTKRELKECGKIELSKLSQPKLQFSMTMANIYALPEFATMAEQFKLGNVIKVEIRRGYIKQSRLLQINIGLDDLSDFSCEFGDLTSFKTQSDIHADLLSQAISAGKSVASNASYWTKGTDQVNEIGLRIQRGLLDAATSIKSIDGTQGVEIGNYGIMLRKTDSETQEYDPEQGWITNNKFLYSNDAFKTVKSVFGKYKIDDDEYWGLLAEAVIAGYIEGSKIKGGTIQIGEYDDEPGRFAFEVDEKGNVSMLGGAVQFTETENSIERVYESMEVTSKDIEGLKDQVANIKDKNMYDVKVFVDGPTTMVNVTDTAILTCKVYAWDTDITDTIDASEFYWVRSSNKPERDEIWNAMPEHQGVKTIIIGVDDIDENVSFNCQVNLPE